MEVLIPVLFNAFLGVVTLLLLARLTPEDERPWLRKTLVVAYVLRAGIAVFFEVFRDFRIFHEDSEGYEVLATLLARSWWGTIPPMEMGGTNPGYYYLGGAICFIFGPYRLNLPLFNSLIGTLTVFLIYRAARMHLHLRVARLAAALVAFTPSMILWSGIALKDALTTFLIVVALVSCMSLKRRFTIHAFILVVLPILALQPIRFYLIYFVCLAVVGSLVFDKGLGMLTGVYKQIFVLGALATVFVATGLAGRTLQETEFLNLEALSNYRNGLAVSARSGFAVGVDISTPGKALAFLPVGMANLMLGPFPWQMTSLRAVIAVPETVVWWVMFPATLKGAVFMARHRFSEISPVLLFAITLICAYSLLHGNIGSGFRQRSQIFVFLFIFSAVGWYQRKCKKAGIDEGAILGQPRAAAA